MLPLLDNLEVLIIECRVKYDNNVKPKRQVDEGIYNNPRLGLFKWINECHSIRNDERAKYQDNGDIKIPTGFELIEGIDLVVAVFLNGVENKALPLF